MRHTKGVWKGQSFRLRPWQEWIIRSAFGTLNPDGSRQYRQVYIEIPRKNGKTELAAAFALYLLLGDQEPGPEIYGAAVDAEQAHLVFSAAETMCRLEPELTTAVEIIPSRRRIIDRDHAGFYAAIPADAASAHGYNAHGIIYDELHAAPNRELWDVLTTSTGARRQPLTVVITTAGYDRASICYELHDYAVRVRDGIVTDPTFLPVIYGAADADDWQDERVWHRVNPALGDFRSLEEMRTMARQAAAVPARQNVFRRLYLDQWTESETRWLDPDEWTACAGPVAWPAMPQHLSGRPVWLGVDLSKTTDLTALVAVSPGEDGCLDVAAEFWLPERVLEPGVRSRLDREAAMLWAAHGALHLTPGPTVDYEAVLAAIRAWSSRCDVREVAYDPWNATGLMARVAEEGAVCVEIRQGFASLSAPSKELERLIRSRTIRHGGHPVLARHAMTVVTESDPSGNLKPSKRKSTEHIDGITALVTALARVMVSPAPGSVYDGRGLVVL